MKASELMKELEKYPDFDVEFVFVEDPKEGDVFLTVRKFNNIKVDDIGHSDKIIQLSGDEY